MPAEDTSTSPSGLDVNKLVRELEIPYSPDHVHWRVTNTTIDTKRGQVVPYADPRAYTDRLNALFTPQGWTRKYKIDTMNNITRVKKGESLLSGKVLVTCTVTIIGLWSHSGTGEEWADDDNGMTSAEGGQSAIAWLRLPISSGQRQACPPLIHRWPQVSRKCQCDCQRLVIASPGGS